MTAHLSGRDLARLNRDGVAAMNPEQALELFDAALAVDHPVVVAARLDRAALDARASRRRVAGVVQRPGPPPTAASGGRQSLMPPNRGRRWPNVYTRWRPTINTACW